LDNHLSPGCLCVYIVNRTRDVIKCLL